MVESDQRKKKLQPENESPGEADPPKASAEGRCLVQTETESLSVPCSVSGRPPAGGPGSVGGLRRAHGVPERGRRELPSAAEAAGLLPPAARPEREEQRGQPGEGERSS